MASTRVLQQQGQQQRQFQQCCPQRQWHPQQRSRPQQQLRPQQLWRPQQPWWPGGSGSVCRSSSPTSLGDRRGGRDVGPCHYRILTGPDAGTTCWRPDHSAVGACLVTSPAVTTVVASLSFTLDSGTSQCFFRDHTTITPPSAPVPVALADPTSGPVVARSSNTLPCSAVPSGFFTGLYIPSFSRNLVGVGYLQDRGITVTFPVHGRTAIYTDSSTGAVLATFTREPHSAQRDYELHSLDFSSASLQGRLHEEIWLHCPLGFTDTFLPGTKWSLRRPVYGLLQSPREWHDTLRSTLRDLGFRPSSTDPSPFVRIGSTPFFILVYVDDLVFATADRAALAEVKSELQKRHTCNDLGELHRYLGLHITRVRALAPSLTQPHMVQQVLRRFGFHFSTIQPTPLAVDHRLTGAFPHEPFESSGPYAGLVGYLMTAAVRVAKYLATTSGMGLVLGGTQPLELTGHCDSSYADDAETQRSTQGYCFNLGAGAVSWRSTRSSSVASSSAEAEIYAAAMAAQELRWLTFLLADLGERPRSAPTLYSDNKAMILLCREPRLESRVKHFDVNYFLLRELQRRGQARLDFVASEANTADVFTKALAPGDHHKFCVQLGLVEVGPRLL
ncbi:unnamed protein product [Closterium sp. NIES-54]